MTLLAKTTILLTLALTFVTTSMGQNIIDLTYGQGAGSFEAGFFDLKDFDPRTDYMLLFPGMTNLVGWTIVGSQGVHWTTAAVQSTTDGNKAIDLQGYGPPPFSMLSTTIPTVPGDEYVLSFDASGGYQPDNQAVVSCGSLTNTLIAPQPDGGGTNSVFIRYRMRFTALGSNTVLSFRVTSSLGYGPIIDRVSVEAFRPQLSIRVSEVELCWETVATKVYQVQHRSVLAASLWTNLGGPVQGTGITHCINDSVPVGEPQRFYRVITVP